MKIPTTAEALHIVVLASSSEPLVPKMKEKKPVHHDDGRPVFAASRVLSALRLDDDGNPVGTDSSITISLLSQPKIQFGQSYRLTGKAWITPFISGSGEFSRQGLSILAEGIAPIDPKTPVDQKN